MKTSYISHFDLSLLQFQNPGFSFSLLPVCVCLCVYLQCSDEPGETLHFSVEGRPS